MIHPNIYYALSSACLILLILVACFDGLTHGAALYTNMQKLKIPEIIPITSSTGTVKIQINGNDVKPGDPIPARSFRNLDFNKITWDHDADTRYTMMLLDLDRKVGGLSPNNTSLTMYNQYTSINIPGNMINLGQAVVAFDAPVVPCQPSAKHRLVLLVFQQDETIDIASVVNIATSTGPSTRRENFKLEDFIAQNRLSLVAANIISALGESGGVCSGSMSASTTSTLMVTLAVLLGVYYNRKINETFPF